MTVVQQAGARPAARHALPASVACSAAVAAAGDVAAAAGREARGRRGCKAFVVAVGVALAWAASVGSRAARADTLQLLTEENRPLSYALPSGSGSGAAAGGSGVGGICAEVVQAMAQRLGVAPQVTLLPWARAFERAQKDANTGLFCTARTPEREALFQWVGPLMAVEGVFYARRGSGQRLDSLDEARAASTILVVRSFFTHQFLQAQGFTNLHTVSRPEDMLRMLMNDRAPLMFANSLTVPEMAAQQGVALADLVPLRSVLRVDEYLAFSPRTPPQTVARWASALAALRRDGTLGRILARWNAVD
jgi:polar amino acid transport system substrate-binding protein